MCIRDSPTIAHNFKAKELKGQGKVKIVKSESMKYVDTEKFISHISEKTKLVATSRVFFLSGYINDYEKILKVAKKNNALFFLDDYQATGQLPIDVKDKDIDIMVSGGLKWLLGGSGIVYMYVKKELIDQLEPSVTGWFSHKRQFEFDPHTIEFSDTASRFETGTPSISAVYPAEQGLKLINDIGVENIRDRTLHLTSLLVNSLIELGFSLKVPENLGDTTKNEKDQNNGLIELLHGSKMFLSDSHFKIKPTVGSFYFFPNYLMHTVYPFKDSKEERRSISFNATIDDEIYDVYSL